MKLPFPRRFKAWLVALVSLTAVALVAITPMMRPRAQSSTTYTFTDLGTLGGTYSRARGINNCGMIVGESAPTGTTPTHPFLWRDSNGNLLSDAGEMKDLGTLGGVRGLATDINASGLVVGTSTILNGDERAFRWFDLDGDGTPDSGEMIDLGVLPNHSTHGAYGVNDNGQIVGSAEDSNLVTSGFIWNANSGLQVLAPLNGVEPSYGYAINNSSHIAGYAATLDHAFVFNGTTNIDLQTFGGPRSIAYDINAAGHAVGFADVDNSSSSPPSHAFKWNGSALQDLGVLTGGLRSQAKSINSSGTIVGYSEVTGGALHAFAHDGTQMYDLNALVTNLPAGWVLHQADAINDGGQIVGYGTFNGEARAFLLTPTAFTSTCSPTVTVTVSPASVSEDGATNLTYTLTRAPVTSTALTVNFSATGTADSSDYGISSVGSVTIPANQQSATVTVDPATDFAVEPNETVVLTTTAGTGYIVGTPTSATGTINNDDLTNVSVAVAPPSANEDGGTDLVYTFTRNSTIGSLTVNFSVGGTADPSTDYGQTGAATFTPPTGTVTFADGSANATVTVNPSTDATVESDETAILMVTTGAGYTVGSPSAATGTITNDDSIPSVSVAVAPPSAAEDGSDVLTYTFTRTGSTANALTANFSVGGTAGFSSDYGQTGAATFTASTGTVTIPVGMASATVTIDPTVDTQDEPNETVILTVTPDAAYTIGGSPASGMITDDDATPTIQITSVTAPEPNSGSTLFVFTVSLTNPSSSQITVNYATDTTGATATGGANCAAGIDFVSITSTGLTFSPGDTSKQVSVTVCGDDDVEPDETFFVNLSGNSINSNLPGNTKGTGTITNDDTLPTVTVGVSNSPVAEDGATNLVYTFTRTGVTTGALTVNFFVGGTAVFSGDYTQTGAATYSSSAGTVTLSAGSSSATVTLDPTADTTVESDETAILTITANAAYTVGSPSSATGTITNDDVAMTVQLQQSTFTVIEDSQVATITVTRSGDASSSATVKYSTSDLAGLQSCTIANTMASERCDYTTAVGRITFAPAETSKTFTVPIVNDVWVEGNETFFVNLSSPVGASLGSQTTSTVEINDNDFAAPTSNPIFGVEYFIRALYRDILNRQPDSTGLQNWIDTLTPCPNGGFGEPPTSTCDRLHIAAGFFQSDEYLNRGYWAFRFYMVSFNQRPTYAQFIPDLSEVGGPKSPAEEEAAKIAYADAFVQRPTFIALYGGLSGQALADALTQKTGLPQFTVTGGMTNGQILRAIAERQTSLDKFLTEGTVSILYFGFQRRDPDAVGYQNNVDTLNANPNNLRHMIFIFIYSTEYLNRFGPQ